MLTEKKMQKDQPILKYFIIIKIFTCEVKNIGYFNLDSVNRRRRKTIPDVNNKKTKQCLYKF